MIKTVGLVLNTYPYSESSLILKIISWDHGPISIIAKGIRRKQESLMRFGEYEFQLYPPKEEGLYLLKDHSLIRDFSSYPSPQSWAAADCGLELFSKILFPQPDNKEYYTLITEYLKYLQKTKHNGILIFWRMFSRLLRMMGVPLNFSICAICGKECQPVAYNPSGELICAECKATLPFDHVYHDLSLNAQKIIELLPEIGNHLEEIKVNQVDITQINELFLFHYSSMQKQNMKLKSLNVLCQFYP